MREGEGDHGGVAVPIFEPIIQAVWANVAPKTALVPPSPEARRKLSCKSVLPAQEHDPGRAGAGHGARDLGLEAALAVVVCVFQQRQQTDLRR